METKFSFDKNSRRGFLRHGSLLVASATVAGLTGITSCSSGNANEEKEDKEEQEEEMVSANEDLMREHGLLQRMLLIYDTAMTHFRNNEDFDPSYIRQTATIIKNFIEDYHEKLEEDYLFPRLEKANKLTDLVAVLRRQHKGGRSVTAKILELTKNGSSLNSTQKQQLIIPLLQAFNTMYRPHEAREDTILFPTFKKVVSQNEYDSLGEDFEKIEHQKFGEGGFDQIVDKVAGIEKQMGIYELDQFTPKV